LKALFSIRNQDTDYHIVMADADPRQATIDIREAMRHVAVKSPLDMGDFAASFISTGRADYGAACLKLLPGGPPHQYITRETKWHYVLTKPERGLRIDARQILGEDKKRVSIPFYDGLFSDFEDQLPAIIANRLAPERKRNVKH
jgi:hypothetical protein